MAEPPGPSSDADAQADGPTTPLQRALLPRANCTHIIMDYFYTREITCDGCGNAPTLGWLYVCQQDNHSEALARRQMSTLDEIHGKEPVPSRLEELKAWGLSRSVLDQIKQGNVYDPFHIEVLKNQKLNVLRVMDEQLSHEGDLLDITSESSDKDVSSMSNGAKVALAATTKWVQKLGHFQMRSQVIPKCNFKCCQSCRPYLRDRAHISLDAAARGDLDPERFLEQTPFIANVKHIRNWGLRSTYRRRFYATHESTDEGSTISSTISDDDETDSEDEINSGSISISPSSPFPISCIENLRHRHTPPGFYDALCSQSTGSCIREVASQAENQVPHGTLRRIAHSLTPQSISRSKSHGSLLDYNVQNSSLRRVSSHRILSPGDPEIQEQMESIELREQSQRGSGTTSSNNLFYLYKSSNRYYPPSGNPSPRSIKTDTSQASASSEEVPVEGGIALTEEAVENQLPDLITQV